MHELGITQSLLDLALKHAQAAGATRITVLHLVIGELSSVVDESVRFYWDFIGKGSIAEGAALHFERVGATLGCQDCGHEFPLNEDYRCPACGGGQVIVRSGTDFYLKSIEVED